ncbi:MAG: hypothetical protein EOQ43_15310 [Mesorhizobium sp.]|nr:MAG: hypothetical protein EOQ43_15310 [Mesorhizobium sp.]
MKRPAPDRIPLSPPRSLTNNFFVVHLVERVFVKEHLVRGLVPEGVKVLYFNGNGEPGYEAIIPNRMLGTFEFKLDHYLWGYTIVYRAPLLYLLQRLFGHAYWLVFWEKRKQSFFNAETLVRHDRIEVLRYFITKTEAEHDFRIGPIGLMEDLHTHRSFSHPQHDRLLQYYQMLLESLADAGYLGACQHHSFGLLPKGMSGLSEYELEERRHTDNKKQQSRIGWLTVALVMIGVVQAGITYFTIPPDARPFQFTVGSTSTGR